MADRAEAGHGAAAVGGAGLSLSVDCPSRPVLDQIADKWSLLVMTALERPLRFNQIRRHVEGITQRVLTQTLRRLERNGMVARVVLPTSPVGVEYSLTPLGQSLREPFGHLYAWSIVNAAVIEEHQAAYDRNHLSGGP